MICLAKLATNKIAYSSGVCNLPRMIKHSHPSSQATWHRYLICGDGSRLSPMANPTIGAVPHYYRRVYPLILFGGGLIFAVDSSQTDLVGQNGIHLKIGD